MNLNLTRFSNNLGRVRIYVLALVFCGIAAYAWIHSASFTANDSDATTYQITITPGMELRDMPSLFAATALVTEEETQAALHDRALLREMRIPVWSFEGYLFPGTYEFTRPISIREMPIKIYSKSQKQITDEMFERATNLNFKFHQALTLASIIEKEAGSSDEKKLVSSVFHNRLRLGMPLQSNSTVIYGLPSFDGEFTKEHLRTHTPYNTYRNTGLPATPICTTSISSIEAALDPAHTDYLYFVSRGDGANEFSKTLEEHKQAVRKYQEKKGAAARETT